MPDSVQNVLREPPLFGMKSGSTKSRRLPKNSAAGMPGFISAILASIAALAAVSAVGLYQIYPQIKADFNTDRDRYMVPEHAAEIWQLRDVTDRYTTEVLWDEATMFAFCDYEHGYGLHRLPYFVVQDESQLNYPENEDFLKTLVAERIEVIVIHRSSQAIVEDLLADLGIVAREIQVSEFGGRYLIYWIK